MMSKAHGTSQAIHPSTEKSATSGGSSFRLYSYFKSSCSYRVRIALHIKKMIFETLPVHLLKDGGEQHSEKYRKLNPKGEVPFFVHGTFGLGQSMAILEYLEEIQPEPALFGKSLQERAHIRQLCEIINSGVQPLQNLKVHQYLTNELGVSEEKKMKWTQRWIHEGLKAFEELLPLTKSKFCTGDIVTAADCLLIPQLYSSRRFETDLTLYPRLLEIEENCQKIEAFRAAHPDQQT